MDGERQKTQVELALATESRGEAPKLNCEGTESATAERDTESLAEGQLREQVCRRENLKRALARVKRNKGSAGVDGMTVGELSGYLKVPAIRERLLAGQYQPLPVRRVEIDKPGGRTSESSAFPACSTASSNKRCCRCWSRTLSRHSRNSVLDSVRGARRIKPWRWRKPTLPKAISG